MIHTKSINFPKNHHHHRRRRVLRQYGSHISHEFIAFWHDRLRVSQLSKLEEGWLPGRVGSSTGKCVRLEESIRPTNSRTRWCDRQFLSVRCGHGCMQKQGRAHL
jgi:hypothetical protein